MAKQPSRERPLPRISEVMRLARHWCGRRPDQEPCAAHIKQARAELSDGRDDHPTSAPPVDPPWLLELVKAAEQAARESVCNKDHESHDGCEGCAWHAVVEAIPFEVRIAAGGWVREAT